MKRNVSIGDVKKDVCETCGAPLTYILGEATALVVCQNNKNKEKYKLLGDGKCDFQYVTDRVNLLRR